MKTLIAGIISLMSVSCAGHEFALLHYNIKELDSSKIREAKNEQIAAVKKVLKERDFDILSLNEVQYDMPGVPNASYKTTGKNLDLLKKKIDLESWTSIFAPANTGMNAKKDRDGNYVLDPNAPGARELADQVNFGTLPGQYSTGALTHYKVLKKTVISDLKWKEFNPSIDLSKYAAADGSPLPEDIKLFDKNFSDIALKVGDKELRLILLHTVPAFNFGNPSSPNYERNRDQLRFLEYYLTGKTDIAIELSHIKPIKGKSFIAVGDFNVDTTSSDPGAAVMKRLFKKTSPWMEPADMSFSNESASFAPRPFRLMLDYILVSSNIEPIEGEILHPNFQRIELGCGDNISQETREDMVKKTYSKDGETCSVLVSKEYETFKKASDHFPIYGRFVIR